MIPTNWSQVTLESYVPFQKTLDEVPETELQKHDLRVKRACLLANVEPEVIMNMTMDEIAKVDDLIKSPRPTKIVKSFRINGQTYRVKLDPRKYNAGEYMAVMNACKDNGGENLHRILFLVCEPVNNWGRKKKFTPDEFEARMKDFKQLPVSIAYPIAVFFWTLSRKLTDVILDYSEETMTKQREEMEAAYSAAMDG